MGWPAWLALARGFVVFDETGRGTKQLLEMLARSGISGSRYF
jgi:hypothetical protein